MTAEEHLPRAPVWSGALTTPLAGLIPGRWRTTALTGIKAVHTAIFASIAAALLLVLWDGLLGRPTQRTLVAGGMVVGEIAIFASNNQVCPLTPLAEHLGARRGSVADIFLPDWLSRRIPIVGGTIFVLGLVLNARAWLLGRRRTQPESRGRAKVRSPLADYRGFPVDIAQDREHSSA